VQDRLGSDQRLGQGIEGKDLGQVAHRRGKERPRDRRVDAADRPERGVRDGDLAPRGHLAPRAAQGVEGEPHAMARGKVEAGDTAAEGLDLPRRAEDRPRLGRKRFGVGGHRPVLRAHHPAPLRPLWKRPPCSGRVAPGASAGGQGMGGDGQAHRFECRVYYEDTDLAGIVYYANYLKFIERARSEWVRALGLDQRRLKEEAGLVLAVRRIEADYLAPARFDDMLTDTTALEAGTAARIVLDQRVARDDVPLFRARVTLVCMGAAGTARRLPARLRDLAAQGP
jgi:acyl-CoA thioester hydrolase